MWIITVCSKCGKPYYWYGDIEDDYECYDCGSTEYDTLTRDEWSAENIAAITANELENGNYHSWTWFPEKLVEIMREVHLSNSQCKLIMEKLSNEMWKNI